MSYDRSSLRYAHTNGHTSLKYITTPDAGDFIVTCGSDGDIRKWRGIDDDDPSSSCLGEFVLCVEQEVSEDGTSKAVRLLASTDRNTVLAYTFPDMEADGTLMRFTAPVTCIRSTKSYTAAGSEDMEIKVILKNAEEESTSSNAKEVCLQGHKGPVLALDICETKKLLASAGGDGTIIVWSLGEPGKELKRVAGI